MTFAEQLRQEALSLGNEHKRREANLQKEHDGAILVAQQKKAMADGARLAFERGLNFSPALGADFRCPNCWVAQGAETALKAVPSDNPKIDRFACETCGYGLDVHI